MTFTLLIMTTGEEILFESLKHIKDNSSNIDILVWYNLINQEVDNSYLERVRNFTKNIIICTQNKGIPMAIGSAMLYSKSDYFMLTGADVLVRENFISKLLKPFHENKKVVMSGQSVLPITSEYVINQTDNFPDNFLMIKREAIDKVGGILPAFDVYGHCYTEWQCRAFNMGYDIASCKDVAVHSGDKHEGRDKLKNFDTILANSRQTMKKANFLKYKGYNWWSSKL